MTVLDVRWQSASGRGSKMCDDIVKPLARNLPQCKWYSRLGAAHVRLLVAESRLLKDQKTFTPNNVDAELVVGTVIQIDTA